MKLSNRKKNIRLTLGAKLHREAQARQLELGLAGVYCKDGKKIPFSPTRGAVSYIRHRL